MKKRKGFGCPRDMRLIFLSYTDLPEVLHWHGEVMRKKISITTSLLPLSTLMFNFLFLFSKINADHDNQAVTSTTGGFRGEKVDETGTTPIATHEKFTQDNQIEHKIRIDECSVEAGTACREYEVSLPKGGYFQYTTEIKCARVNYNFSSSVGILRTKSISFNSAV